MAVMASDVGMLVKSDDVMLEETMVFSASNFSSRSLKKKILNSGFGGQCIQTAILELLVHF